MKAPRSKSWNWHVDSHLFGPLPDAAQEALAALPKALERVWPLPRHYQRQLPTDIRELSRLLTFQRSGLRQNYWSKPAFISAYLYYFLPWNIVRFCRLYSGLPLRMPISAVTESVLLMDAGAGPLTASLALWIARPEWRERPVCVFGLDSTKKPLELGRNLFAALAAELASPCWEINTAVGPLEAMAKLAPAVSPSGRPLRPWLSLVANVLNEMKAPKFEGASDSPDHERLIMLLASWRPFWQTGAQVLFMEPGTRLGGTIIMKLRRAAMELGLEPESPCSHAGECPLGEDITGRLPSTWCHFVFSAQDAPEWLKALSRKAGLFKTSLTLSLLLLSTKQAAQVSDQDKMQARIISRAFLAGENMARYGCCAAGRVLLPNSERVVSGSLCSVCCPEGKPVHDARSGVLVVEPARQS